MPQLASMSRKDMLIVLQELIKLQEAEKYWDNQLRLCRIEVSKNQKIMQKRKKSKQDFAGCLLWFIAPVIIMAGLLLTGYIIEFDVNGIHPLTGIVLGVVALAFVVFLASFIIKKSEKKHFLNDISSSTSGFEVLNEINNKLSQAKQQSNSFYQRYTVPVQLQNPPATRYVYQILRDYPNVSMSDAVNDFYRLQHEEMLRDEIKKQTIETQKLREDNERQHREAMKEAQYGNRLRREANNTLNDIRWYK
ncbi:MAG: hypothetical protein IJ447_02720 [Clostridia bacterium]|nr:hypothetical protein [Clostridia bacterium]